MKSKYNLDQLSYLIGYLRDVAETFGYKSESIKFYKRQIEYQVSIGQVGYSEAQVIEKLVGMENTDAVKWDIAKNKINQFIKVMQIVYKSSDDKFIGYVIENAYKNKDISQSVYDILRDIFNISSTQSTIKIAQEFGAIPHAHPHGRNNNTNKIVNRAKVEKQDSMQYALRGDVLNRIQSIIDYAARDIKNVNKEVKQNGHSLDAAIRDTELANKAWKQIKLHTKKDTSALSSIGLAGKYNKTLGEQFPYFVNTVSYMAESNNQFKTIEQCIKRVGTIDDHEIRVRNPNACCSGDRTYFDVELVDLISVIDAALKYMNNPTEIIKQSVKAEYWYTEYSKFYDVSMVLKYIVNGDAFEILEITRRDDGCHVSKMSSTVTGAKLAKNLGILDPSIIV